MQYMDSVTEMKVPTVENPELTNVFPSNTGVRVQRRGFILCVFLGLHALAVSRCRAEGTRAERAHEHSDNHNIYAMEKKQHNV